MKSLLKNTFKKLLIPTFKLADDHHALCIFDNFKGQLTDDVLQLLEESYIDMVFVLPNCTDQLQLLDQLLQLLDYCYLICQRLLKAKFQQWYADHIPYSAIIGRGKILANLAI